jgi:hypothetical protein
MTTVIMVILEGKYVDSSTRQLPMVQVCFFVGISSIYQCTAVGESTLLMSIMAMASHGCQVFHFLCVACVGKGFEDEFSDNSDLS